MRFLLKKILMQEGNVLENTKNAINSLDKNKTRVEKKLIAPNVSKSDPAVVSILKSLNKK